MWVGEVEQGSGFPIMGKDVGGAVMKLKSMVGVDGCGEVQC